MYKIERMPHSLEIGYVGEKNFRPVEIDMTAWMEKMPEGVPSIVCIRPGETKDDAYIAVTTFEDNVLTWVPSDADLGVTEGEGMIQVWLEEEENSSVTKRGKSIEVITKVKDSVSNPGADTPAAQAGFLEQMTELKTLTVNAAEDAEDAKDDAVAAKEAAEAAIVHQPYIHSTSKHWMVWDNETEAYVDTEILAEGHTPVRGTDYWTQQDQTAVVAAAAQATAGKIIDDTAGEGATGKTWSANKLDETTGLLLNAIQGKYTKPQTGIPALDLTEEVQDTLSAVEKSEERDGIVQNGDTATRNITKDRYVIWKGSLYTASSNIVIGETLSLSNLSPVSDGGFNALRDEIEQKHSIKAYKKYVQQEQSTGSVWIVLDEIVDIENGDEIEILIYQSDKANYGTSWSNTASWNAITIQNKNNSSISLQDDKYMNSDKPAMKKIKKMDGYVMYQTFSNNALTGFGIDFPANLDSFKRMLVDPVSSQLKAGCTVEITIRKTI